MKNSSFIVLAVAAAQFGLLTAAFLIPRRDALGLGFLVVRQGGNGSVPVSQCESTCSPIINYVGPTATERCTAAACCSSTFENAYLNCLTCVGKAKGMTDYSPLQIDLDQLTSACLAAGYNVPKLTFPGQNPNRQLPSFIPSSSVSSTVSSVGASTISSTITSTGATDLSTSPSSTATTLPVISSSNTISPTTTGSATSTRSSSSTKTSNASRTPRKLDSLNKILCICYVMIDAHAQLSVFTSLCYCLIWIGTFAKPARALGTCQTAAGFDNKWKAREERGDIPPALPRSKGPCVSLFTYRNSSGDAHFRVVDLCNYKLVFGISSDAKQALEGVQAKIRVPYEMNQSWRRRRFLTGWWQMEFDRSPAFNSP
ncbi:hypothetical protein APHAL10511_005593 [Amanita phalloides]|nr:hypothetical protein APHAL10511_005593 [Amanita phalloides]